MLAMCRILLSNCSEAALLTVKSNTSSHTCTDMARMPLYGVTQPLARDTKRRNANVTLHGILLSS